MRETIGQRLKKEREARFLTLEQASEATRIRKVFLEALEADDFSVMPSAAQGRGFLRNYAAFLGLDVDEMIAEMQRSAPPPEEVSGPLPQVNLAETELPPLAAEEEERDGVSWAGKLRVSLTSWLGFGRREEGLTAPVNVERVSFEGMEEEKTEALIRPGETDQAEEQVDAAAASSLKRGESVQSFSQKKKNVPSSAVKSEIPRHAPALPADVIFAEIGAQLRERRELISLTLEEVERHTKLRAAFLKALEEGAFDKLPSPVQTRGMLANYAAFLDLDVEEILLRFADGLLARRREKYAETPREKIQTEVISSIPMWRAFIASDLIFGALMIAVLFALAVWGVGRIVASQNKSAEPTALSIAEALADLPLPTPSPAALATQIPAEENAAIVTPLTEGDIPQALTANVVVQIFALERAFLRVSVDGEQVFEGRLVPGEARVFEGETEVLVLTGNAAALRVSYNGRDLGLMGREGEVVSRLYLVAGVAPPTGPKSPTPTKTPPGTSTPHPPATAPAPLPLPCSSPSRWPSETPRRCSSCRRQGPRSLVGGKSRSVSIPSGRNPRQNC
jgi:cytoskeletal protein RodZ